MDFIKKTVRWNEFERELVLPHHNDINQVWEKDDFQDELFPYWMSEWYSVYGLHDELLKIEFQPDDIILELGCGAGVLQQLSDRPKGRWIFSDIVTSSLDFMKSYLNLGPRDHLLCSSWDHPCFSKVDYIVASDVLYEKEYAESIVQLAQKILKPHGKLIVANPQRTGRDSALAELSNLWSGGCTQIRHLIQMNSLKIEIDVAILTQA